MLPVCTPTTTPTRVHVAPSGRRLTDEQCVAEIQGVAGRGEAVARETVACRLFADATDDPEFLSSCDKVAAGNALATLAVTQQLGCVDLARDCPLALAKHVYRSLNLNG